MILCGNYGSYCLLGGLSGSIIRNSIPLKTYKDFGSIIRTILEHPYALGIIITELGLKQPPDETNPLLTSLTALYLILKWAANYVKLEEINAQQENQKLPDFSSGITHEALSHTIE